MITCPRLFTNGRIHHGNTTLRTNKSRITLARLGFDFHRTRAPYSSYQTTTSSTPTSDRIISSLASKQASIHGKGGSKKIDQLTKTSQSTAQHAVLNKTKPTRSKRIYPVRKQFIFESYLDLFTSNQVCLLFRHDSLSSRQWNSIRGKIKNMSSSAASSSTIPFGEFKFREEDEQARLKQQVPKIQVLRTKMILPVLKKLLKDSKINTETYNSLVHTQNPPSSLPTTQNQSGKKKSESKADRSNLTGSLFSITQPKFEPDQIKKVLEIFNSYSSKAVEEQPKISKEKNTSTNKQEKLDFKIKFLIGLIDKSFICKDEKELKNLSNLSNLDSLRSQILALIHQIPTQTLLFNLNFSRASNLIHTLNSHIKTQQLLSSSNQSTDNQSPST